MTNSEQHVGRIEIRRRAANSTLALAILLLSPIFIARSAQAQTFTVLYAFRGAPDGAQPYAGLIRDAAGNFYGTTYYGGDYGSGTVFKLDAIGNETVLYSFGGRGGKYPIAGLIRDQSGNLYGTAYKAGAFHLGTVFKLNTTSKCLKVLHSFAGADGASPYAGLIRDAAGNFYGTTYGGGDINCNAPIGCGTVFKLDATGQESVLHSFAGADGRNPVAGLIRDAAGNFYGTTYGGGDYNIGTVFKLDASGKETVLHSFTGWPDGAYPYAVLTRDAAGNLYGTTLQGGDFNCNPPIGCGTVFKLDATGQESVLHSFAGADGAYPIAGLIRDAAGNFYGTTGGGGDYSAGTVFKLDPTRRETVLHNFTGGVDGAAPDASLIRDAVGNFYGTTSQGGASGYGTVFKIAP